jgi:hypothetical protein
VDVLVTPVQAPNANAFAEWWVRTVRAECLDWLLIIGRSHLEQVLRVYARHYNGHRPHRSLTLQAPDPTTDWPSSPRTAKASYVDDTCLVACSMSTGEPHECVCAPFGCGVVRCDAYHPTTPSGPRGCTAATLP